MPGQIGRFRIVEELGRGAMGIVYKAQDPLLDRTVAIKTILLSGDAAERATYEARFLQEAKAAGRLSHPAIITVHDVGREGDLAYMAMELLAGVELRARMAQERLTVREAVGIAAQVAEGLAFAHEHGVVHRDIKPANVMVVRGGRIKIMDFGIARLQLSDVKTQTGVLLGTPKYMSPEQIAGRALDHRSDIFSLGAVLYEMLVGRAPFTGADTAQLMLNIASAPHTTPSRIVSEVPALLDLIVARALEKDPDARYQDAHEFAADLQACLAGLPDRAKPASRTDATQERLEAAGDATEVVLRPDATEPLAAPGPATDFSRSALTAGFWPLSRGFDSSAAWQRLSRAGPVPARGALPRVLRDADLRVLVLAIVASLAAAAAIVLV
jgi:serine/threonine protein kinase